MKKIFHDISYHLFSLFLNISFLSFTAQQCRRLLKKARQNGPYDMVIIPGVPYKKGEWDLIMKARVLWAKYLYEEKIARNVIFSGAAVYSPWYEGGVMALYAVALGIPEENVFTEIKAEHSTENVYYSYQIARKLGYKKVALASDPFQTKMLRRFTRHKVDPDIHLIPVLYDQVRKMSRKIRHPRIDAHKVYVSDFISIRDRMSFSKRFKGTRGRHIDPLAY